jgi:hypothetical protein
MHKLASNIQVRGAARWQIVVCLLLAALVVYNPFLGGAEFGAGLCVRHPASKRATVGASELQHFTPAKKSASLLSGDALLLFASFTPSLHPSGQRSANASAHTAVIQHLAPSLWFRPPPLF